MRFAVVLFGSLLTVAACGVPETGPQQSSESSALLDGIPWSYWDQGTTPPPGWMTEPDDTWPAGYGPLGYGESYLETTVGYGPDPADKHITTYFRNRVFIIQQQQEIERVYADIMYDDGVVLYIQGQRVFTAGLPGTDPMPPTQLAAGHEANNRYQRIDLTPYRHLFDRGYVYLAAEVHQSEPSSSDLVFDLDLELGLTQQTDGLAIAPRATWTYWDQYTEPSGWNQPVFDTTTWRDGAAPLGYGESYIVTTLRQPQSGQPPTTLYRRIFDVPDVEEVIRLTGDVLYDDGVVVWLNGTRIDSLSMPPGDATFSTLALGHEAEFRYEQRDWSQFVGLLVEHGNVLAVELHQQDRTSSDAVFDLALSYTRSTEPPPPPPPPPSGEDIARGSDWSVWDRGGDLGTAWRTSSYDDSSWSRLAAPMGYGESYLASIIGYGPDADHKYRTTYFRNRFTVEDAGAVTSMVADLMYDDGVVVYINGTEVTRLFMPSGTITASTLASGHETGPSYERHDLAAARGLLVDGVNVIAVEVHQSSDSSSDLTFDLGLDVTAGGAPPPPPPPEAGIARGSSWRYHAAAVAPPYDWRYADFDDTEWPHLPGPLGYGESYVRGTVPFGPDPASKYITTYFRSSFVVEDPAQVTRLFVELMYDDGAAIYLNGMRVLKLRLPDQVGHTTLAQWHEADNTYEPFDLTHAIEYLRPGRNTIAVEVHQESPSSSDLVFDLALGFEAGTAVGSTPHHSSWLYYDQGPLANGWQDSTDNTGWDGATAPIGYNDRYVGFYGQIGDDGRRQPVTTYFRRTFTIDRAAPIQQLRAELLVDDGAVIYLNGVEVARPWMPTGTTIGFDTRATSREAGSYILLDLSSRIPLLRAGVNVLAVEVHQDAAHAPGNPDNDLVFDLSLEIITADTPRLPGCTTPMTAPKDARLTDVWISPGGAAWATGDNGMVGRRQANGWAWCSTGGDPTVGFNAVFGFAEDDVWFGGTGGIMLRWNGSGLERIDPDTSSGDDLRAIWGSSASDVFVVGSGGRVHHYDGASWKAVTVPMGDVNDVWGASAADVWAVGRHFVQSPTGDDYEDECHSTIFRWDPATRSFALERDYVITYGGCGFEGVSGTSAGNLWAVGDQFPAGAAAAFAFTAHFDGTSWDGIHPAEEQAVDRTFMDVAVGAPGAENGAWMVAQGRGIVLWDGTKWASGPYPLTEDLYAIDARGSVMYAVGRNAKVVRWNGVTWELDR